MDDMRCYHDIQSAIGSPSLLAITPLRFLRRCITPRRAYRTRSIAAIRTNDRAHLHVHCTHRNMALAPAATTANATSNHSNGPSLRSIIAPSILSGDFARLADECSRLIESGADWLHIDVMDGHFVPNLTLGAPIVESLRRHSSAFFDVHLMVSRPEQWVSDFAKAGANSYTFHVEATDDPAALIAAIRSAGMRPGITLKPATPLDAVLPFVPLVDMVLVMTVEPGFGGQKFMASQLDKVRTLRAQFPTLNIEVDGGIGPDTIDEAAAAGANVVVSGSAIFKAKNMKDIIQTLRHAIDKHINIKPNNQ